MNNTLIKGLQLLELLSRVDRPQGVTELAAGLGMPKSGVHRLLQSLVDLGFVLQDTESGNYGASLKLWELGNAVMARLDIRRAAEGPLTELRDATLETTHLAILENQQVVYVIRLNSPLPVGLSSAVGRRAPAYAVSTGKALLAFAPAELLEQISHKLEAQTSSTITDPDQFLAEMAAIRARGYSVSRGEWTAGVWGVGAPVRAPDGQVVAAISVTAPAERLKPEDIPRVASLLLATAAKISASLVPAASDYLAALARPSNPGSRQG